MNKNIAIVGSVAALLSGCSAFTKPQTGPAAPAPAVEAPAPKAAAKPVTERLISVSEFRDRMAGAWVGQSIGVSYGWPTEFHAVGKLLPDAEMPVWKPGTVNETFNQDDLYVEMTFLRTLETRGIDVSSRDAGIDFANSGYRLWCANHIGRNNLRNGIAAPDSGHPKFHKETDAIDYQIEADYSGIIAPGIPQAAIDLGNTFGAIMNYGDGLYAGQFVGAMYSAAYFTSDREEIVESALKCIPAESKYAEMVRDMLAWYRADRQNWQQTWTNAVAKYQSDSYLGKCGTKELDVKINGAMVLLGLLYGEGDMDQTMRISTQGGYDSDCNPSSACGVLGVTLGLKGIPPKYYKDLSRTNKWEFTDYTYDALLDVSEKLARQFVVKYGGSIDKDESGAEWFSIPVKPVKPNKFHPSENPGPAKDVRYTEEELGKILYRPNEKQGTWSEKRH